MAREEFTTTSPLGKMLQTGKIEEGLAGLAVSVSLPIIAENGADKTPAMLILEAKDLFKNKDYAEAIAGIRNSKRPAPELATV